MDLSTTYLGLKLKNPIVASSSPLTRDVESIKTLEAAGIAAVVMPSLFEEQIENEMLSIDAALRHGLESNPEALSYLPRLSSELTDPDQYLRTIEQAKKTTGIPIIASLNGMSPGGWMRFAGLIEDAGADAIELNIYYMATDPRRTSHDIETSCIDAISSAVRRAQIPVSVKIGPYFSSIPRMAQRIADAGSKGLVLFNRFYQPDLDIENLEVTPRINFSRSEDMLLPLRWTAILYKRVNIDIAITSGVHNGADAIKAVMAGGNVAMIASALMLHGPTRVTAILDEIKDWMQTHEYASIKQMRGSMSQANVPNPDVYERANYMKMISTYKYDPNKLPH
jgi:dihydroorotate dehydrogenase (fumarate)